MPKSFEVNELSVLGDTVSVSLSFNSLRQWWDPSSTINTKVDLIGKLKNGTLQDSKAFSKAALVFLGSSKMSALVSFVNDYLRKNKYGVNPNLGASGG